MIEVEGYFSNVDEQAFQDEDTFESGIFLNVAVTGFPPPLITWYHNEKQLDDGAYKPTNQIPGKYSCIATNSCGSASTSCNVNIATKMSSEEGNCRITPELLSRVVAAVIIPVLKLCVRFQSRSYATHLLFVSDGYN